MTKHFKKSKKDKKKAAETLPGKRGPKDTLTPEVHGKIVLMIKAGNFPATAAAYAGITERRLKTWMERGFAEKVRLEDPEAEPNPNDTKFVRFFEDVMQAEAFAEVRMTAKVTEAASDDPKFATWWLERKAKQRWSPSFQGEMKVTTTGELNVNARTDIIAALRPEEILALSEMSLRFRDDASGQSPGGDAELEQLHTSVVAHNRPGDVHP